MNFPSRTRVTIIALSLVGITLAILYKEHPFSLLYRMFHSYEELLNRVEVDYSHRQKMARKYFETFEYRRNVLPSLRPTTQSDGTSNQIDLVVTIVTTARTGHNYLLQTAASVHDAAKHDELFHKKHVFVCNVDDKPWLHKEASFLQKHLPYIHKRDSTNNMDISDTIPIPNILDEGKIESRRYHEFADYVFCLNVSMTFKPKFLLVLEDDVEPLPDMFSTLHHVLKYRLNAMNGNYAHAHTTGSGFTYLRLFYPQSGQGFVSMYGLGDVYGVGDIAGIVGIIEAVCVVCICGIAVSVITRPSLLWSAAQRINIKRVAQYGLICFIYLAIIGRQNLMEYRRFAPQLYWLGQGRISAASALVYPSNVVPDLMTYLTQHTDNHKDLKIYHFSKINGHTGYQLEPNVFHHLGFHSSVGGVHWIEEFVRT